MSKLTKNRFLTSEDTDLIKANKSMIRKYKKENGATHLDSCREKCRTLTQNGILPDDGSIIELLKDKEMSTAELLCLTEGIISVLFSVLEENCENKEICENCVRSLSLLPDIDTEKIITALSKTEPFLAADPTGEYEKMTVATKRTYRKALVALAKKKRSYR